jgi:hypothetical protein
MELRYYMTHTFINFLNLDPGILLIIGFLSQMFLISRMKLEIIRKMQLTPEQAQDSYNYWKLLRMHKSVIPTSRIRPLFWASLVTILLGSSMMIFQLFKT